MGVGMGCWAAAATSRARQRCGGLLGLVFAEAFLLLLLLGLLESAHSQECSSTNPCQAGMCCSKYGFCGITADYCAPANKCQAGCWPSPTPRARFKRGTYFASWTGQDPAKINATVFTHVFYAFGQIDPVKFKLIKDDPSECWGCFTKGVGNSNAAAKAILSVGGGTDSAAQSFATMARTAAGRTAFINNAIKALRAFSFQGIDLDWEFPDTPGNKSNFAALLTAFRSAIAREAKTSSRPPLLLTAAVSAYGPAIAAAYDIKALSANLDLALVMCYDFHGEWESVTGMHSALYDPNDPAVSCVGGVQAWTQGGFAPAKLLMGLASYGKSWTLANRNKHGVGAKATGPGAAGKFTQEPGTLSFAEINLMLRSGGVSVFNATTTCQYAYKGHQWVSYDNTNTISLKVQFARQRGLAGYGFWAYYLDDNFSLANAAYLA